MKPKVNAKTRLLFGILLMLLLLLVFEGISVTKYPDFEASQIRDDIILVGALDNTSSIAQTFVAQKPYLSSIKFLVDCDQNKQAAAKDYYLFVQLQDANHTRIASKSYSILLSSKKLDIEFSFAPQPDSLNKKYYLLIETNAPVNTFSVWVSLFDSYAGGKIYLKGDGLPFDLTFWTYYKPSVLFLITDTFIRSAPRFIHLFFISLMFLLFGLCVRVLCGCQSKDLIEDAVYSVGIGICMPPLLLLGMSLLGIHINRVNILAIFGILVVFTVLKCFASFRSGKGGWYFPTFNKEEVIVFILLFILAAFTRVAQINDLGVPNWVDGLIHQEFLTRILERQVMSFEAIYPKGFHANVIFDYLLFDGSLPESILVMGQWLSLISGATFYLLARKLLGKSYGLFAVGIYWFWTVFPAFLINWGRYPFLQGLVILPVAIAVFRDNFLGARSRNILLMILIAGLGLTYYGSFMIFAAFLVTYVINEVVINGFAGLIKRIRGIVLSMLPIILTLLIRLYEAFRNGFFGQASAVTSIEDGGNILEIFLNHGGWLIWTLGILGLALVFLLENQKLFFLIEWFLILLIFDVLQSVLGITISSLANTIIFLSIPLALFTGFVFKVLLVKITRYIKLQIYIVLVLLAASGAYGISSLIEPSTVLYSPADQKAMEWIIQNTPSDGTFMVNSFLWGDTYAPSDGGGWLTLITERKSVLYDLGKLEAVIMDRQINYIYVGRGYGDINPDVILNDHRFSLIYNRDGIRIFKLNSVD